MNDHCMECGAFSPGATYHPHLYCTLIKAGVSDPGAYLKQSGWQQSTQSEIDYAQVQGTADWLTELLSADYLALAYALTDKEAPNPARVVETLRNAQQSLDACIEFWDPLDCDCECHEPGDDHCDECCQVALCDDCRSYAVSDR